MLMVHIWYTNATDSQTDGLMDHLPQHNGALCLLSAWHSVELKRLFTFYPRDAMLARVIAIAARLSVRLSVTSRYCVKKKKARVMISSLRGSSNTLVF